MGIVNSLQRIMLKVAKMAAVLAGSVSISVSAYSPATDFRTLFTMAIDAPSGVVKSEVHGPLLNKIQSEVHTNARVFVEVRAIQVLPQPGCKRLKVTFSAPESRLPTKDGGTAPLDGVGFEVNMCRDGNPPGVISSRKE